MYCISTPQSLSIDLALKNKIARMIVHTHAHTHTHKQSLWGSFNRGAEK